ncbi:MAG: HEAT repeat domain-containing protein [Anaerolineae bacterium]|nr:HEAT repeat domain-containing protein [Anaerolineae bacterium]
MTAPSSSPNIWQLQARQDIPSLIAALQYPDPEVRRRAAVALRIINATEAVPALKIAFENETNPSTRMDIFSALHGLNRKIDINSMLKDRDIDGLVKALQSTHTDTAIAAAHALAKINDRSAVEPLVMLFQNTTTLSPVRLAAAEALLTLQCAPTHVTLLGALDHEDWHIRRNAAAILGQLQASWAIEPLATALSDSHPTVQRTAAAALRRIGTPEAMTALRTRSPEPTKPPTTKGKPAPAPTPVLPPAKKKQAPSSTTAPTRPAFPILPDTVPQIAPNQQQRRKLDMPPTLTKPVRKLIDFLRPGADDQD